MTQLDHGTEFEKTGATLDGMESPEYGVQQTAFDRILLKLDQLCPRPLQYLSGRRQDVLQDLVISICTHGRWLSGNNRDDTDCLRSGI